MNGENINNSGENKEFGASKEFQKELGGVAVENFDLLSQEELDKQAEETEKTRKALLEKWIKINATAKKIEQEKARREEYNRQKELAASGGIMRLTGWVNKHPEDLKEFVHPKLQSGIEKALKEHAESGKSFFDILYASRELTARLAEAEAAAKAADAILAEYTSGNAEPVVVDSGEQSSTSSAEFDAEKIADAALAEVDAENGKDDLSYPLEDDDDYEYDIEPVEDEYDIDDDEKDDNDDEKEDDEEKDDKAENKDDLSYSIEDDDEVVELDDSNEAYNESIAVDEVLEEAKSEIEKRLKEIREQKESSTGERVDENSKEDEEVDKPKEKIIDRVKKKIGVRFGFKNIIIGVAAVAAAIMVAKAAVSTWNADSQMAYAQSAAGNNQTQTEQSVESEQSAESLGAQVATVSSETEVKAERPTYNSKFNFMGADEEVKDHTLDFAREVQEGKPDLFDVAVRGNGEAQTTNNKETKGAFGPIFDASELEGSTNVLSYLSTKNDVMARDPLYMMYANSWNGALDASDGYGLSVEHMSVDAINEAAEKFKNASPEEKQRILDKIMADEAEAIDGKTMQYASFPANRTYITAHMEKGEDGVKKIAVARSSKPEEFNVLQRLNANGENEFDQGATKLRILKAHGLAPADMEYDADNADVQRLMKRYTVWGERNKCGGQMVITENVVKRKVVKPDIVERVSTVSQEVIPMNNQVTWNSPSGDSSSSSTSDKPTPDTPTPQTLQGKTMTNPWAGNNPAIMTEPTVSFAQESTDNGGDRIVQAGQEQIPEVDTSGVNEAPEAQQDWAEEASAPVEDTGTGGTEDQSASSDAEAASMLAEAESEG